MTLAAIRSAYGVPAWPLARVLYTAGGAARSGVIVGSSGPCLIVRFDDNRRTAYLHPTWGVVYLDPQPPRPKKPKKTLGPRRARRTPIETPGEPGNTTKDDNT